MSIYRVRTVLSGNVTGNGVATHYFDIAGGTPQQAATAVSTFWTGLAGAMGPSTSWSLEQEVDQLDEADGHLEAANAVASASGVGAGGAGDPLPLATQGLLQMRTAQIVNKREVRGRLFLPGAIEPFNAVGIPSTAYRTAVETPSNVLISSANAQWVVWARPYAGGSAGPARLGSKHTVLTAICSPKWAVLTSRRD